VLALVPTIYNAMASQIKHEFGNLFRELCEEQVLLYIQADEVKNRKKQRKVETEVADLRLKLATVQSKNIVLSNREIRLLRYIELTEEDKEKLKGSYKVAKKLEKLENRDNRNLDSDEDDDYDCETGDYPSLESFGMTTRANRLFSVLPTVVAFALCRNQFVSVLGIGSGWHLLYPDQPHQSTCRC